MKIKGKCENCIYWRGKGKYGNEKQCFYLIDNPKLVPMWAQYILFNTISWEGGNCPCFIRP